MVRLPGQTCDTRKINGQADLITRGRSSVWLERLPVTQEVAGSSPVVPALFVYIFEPRLRNAYTGINRPNDYTNGMNPQLILGIILFVGGFLLLASGMILGVVLVIIGGILARTGSKDLVTKKIKQQQHQQPKKK